MKSSAARSRASIHPTSRRNLASPLQDSLKRQFKAFVIGAMFYNAGISNARGANGRSPHTVGQSPQASIESSRAAAALSLGMRSYIRREQKCHVCSGDGNHRSNRSAVELSQKAIQFNQLSDCELFDSPKG